MIVIYDSLFMSNWILMHSTNFIILLVIILQVKQSFIKRNRFSGGGKLFPFLFLVSDDFDILVSATFQRNIHDMYMHLHAYNDDSNTPIAIGTEGRG